MSVAKTAIAKGRVQGVGFRAVARRIAQELKLLGVAKNLNDGSVKIVVVGPEKQIALFFEKLKENFGGYILELDIQPHSLEIQYESFSIE